MDQQLYNADSYDGSSDFTSSQNYRLPFCRDVLATDDKDRIYTDPSSPFSMEEDILFDMKVEPICEGALPNGGRSSLCNSPSSMSSSDSPTQLFRSDDQSYFMNDRPETPLDAVKLEQISNDGRLEPGFRLEGLGLLDNNLDEDYNAYLQNTFDDQLFFDTNTTSDGDITSDPFQYINDVPDLNKDTDDEFITIASPPATILNSPITSKRKRNVPTTSSLPFSNISLSKTRDKNIFINSSSQLLSANILKNEEPTDLSFNKGQAVFSAPFSSASSSLTTEVHTKSGVKRKLAGPPLLIYEPVAKASTTAGHKFISVRSVDKNCVKSVGTSNRGPRSGVELNELVVQGSKALTASSHTNVNGGELKATSFPQKTQIQIPTTTLQNILKNNKLMKRIDGQVIPNICIKTEPGANGDVTQQYVKITQHHSQLPPTPPSSTNSDNESTSPRSTKSNCKASSSSSAVSGGPSTTKSSPTLIRVHPSSTITAGTLASQLLSSSQRLTQTHGPLILTDEEKRTLVAEGYPVPSKLPLTKSEEKSLKKVRRKIKNKISAQESRRKKKEYVEKLEKKMDVTNKENLDLKKKLDTLELDNRSLLNQLKSLQALLSGKIPRSTKTATTQTSSCLMMLALSFVFFLGGWLPILSNTQTNNSAGYLPSSASPSSSEDYSSGSMRSRVLMSYKEDQDTATITLENTEAAQITDSCSMDVQSSCKVFNDVKWLNPGIVKNLPGKGVKVGVGDTYDKGRNNLANINDTGEQQLSKIITNTMEPRTAADVIASRKLTTSSGGRVEVLIPVTSGGALDMARRMAQYQIIKE